VLPFFPRKAALRYPVGPAPRTAVLAPWFRSKDAVRVFAEGWCDAAARFRPAALAGTRRQLLELAAEAAPELTHAVIVVSQLGEPLLTTAERQRLWRAFRVPVFTQIVDERGRLLAAECEAHDGLHVEDPERTWPDYKLETGPCACGRVSARLAAPEPAERVRAAAVFAR
jgi:hypothetical protein